MVLAAAAAIPATWGVASATSSGSARLVDQPAAQVAPAAAAQDITTGPAEFVGITPVRVLDTRSGTTVGVPSAAPLGADSTIDVQVAGINGVPAAATSVAINITIDVDATMKSFMTVWPTGEPRPLASANNAEPGLVATNSALIKVGQLGKISVYNLRGAVNVIIDVTGYFVSSADTSTTTTTTTIPDDGSTSSTSSTTSTTTTTTEA
jgi:hypothetical protein